jgi:hypothetical protein
MVSRWPSAVPPRRDLRVVEDLLIGYNDVSGGFEEPWNIGG